MGKDTPKITAITPEQAAKILSGVYKRQITSEQIESIAQRGGLLRPDGSFNLIEYIAYLTGELNRG